MDPRLLEHAHHILHSIEIARRARTQGNQMCSGAACSVGIGLVVYALSERTLNRMIPQDPENPLVDFECRTVLGVGARRVEVLGPAYETEARPVHEGFWHV